MDFIFKNKNSKKKLKSSINKNKLKLSNIIPKKTLLQIIINLLSLLKITILRIKQVLKDLYN